MCLNVFSFCFQSCEICQEQFEMYWEEDEEEWHLKNAIRVDEKVWNLKDLFIIRFCLVMGANSGLMIRSFLSDIPSLVLRRLHKSKCCTSRFEIWYYSAVFLSGPDR